MKKNKLININNYKPIKKYKNALKNKKMIISENWNKKGIYCITNKLNGRKYVGCSWTNLGKRLSNYYQNSYLKKNSGLILPAILKYGQSSFQIEIIKYLHKKNIILKKEKYYINKIKSNYNIRKKNWT